MEKVEDIGGDPGVTRMLNAIKAEKRMDGWANAFAGLGYKKDKAKSTRIEVGTILPPEELELIYLEDGLAAQIIDVPADDATREWIDLDPETDDEEEEDAIKEKIEAELDRLGAETVFNEALKWKRLYGGAIILMGILDGRELDQPVNWAGVRAIDSLKVLTSADVNISLTTFQTDPKQKDFGQPIILDLSVYVGDQYQDLKVHRDRVIIFYGKTAPRARAQSLSAEQRFFGISIVQQIYEDLRNMGGVKASTVNIIYEFIIGKFTFEGLADMLATGKESLILQRMEIINIMKSVIHAVLLDSSESYTRDAANVGGLAELIDRFMMFLSGTSGIPVTRLFGRSAAGMNATGENDLTNYYDKIRSDQKTGLKPTIGQLIKAIQASLKDDHEIEIKFKPLFQMTEKEQAETDKLKADKEKIEAEAYGMYIDKSILTAEDVYTLKWKEAVDPIREEAEAEGPTPEELAEEEAAEARAQEAEMALQEKEAAAQVLETGEPVEEPEEEPLPATEKDSGEGSKGLLSRIFKGKD